MYDKVLTARDKGGFSMAFDLDKIIEDNKTLITEKVNDEAVEEIKFDSRVVCWMKE